MKKTLLLITAGFPFGPGEAPFILPELPYLEKNFDEVVLFSMNSEDPQTSIISSNVSVHRRKTRYSFWNKVIYSIQALFTPLFWQELGSIKKNYGLSLSRTKDALQYIIISSIVLKEILSLQLVQDSQRQMLLYSYWYTEGAMTALRLKERYPELRVITRTHGYDLYLERKENHYQPFKKWMDRRIDRVYFVSLAGKKYYETHYQCLGDNKYFLSYLGVRASSVCTQWNLSHQKVLFSCSNVIPLKRVELIIYGLSKIDNIPIRWVHFGGGTEENFLKQLAKELLEPKENITYDFKGAVPNSEVHNFLSNESVDAFISTSSTEGGVPVSMMEAASYGIPIIGTDVGGIPEIVVPSGGILLSQNPNSQEIAEAVEVMLSWDETTMLSKREQVCGVWRKLFNADKNGKRFAKTISNLFDK